MKWAFVALFVVALAGCGGVATPMLDDAGVLGPPIPCGSLYPDYPNFPAVPFCDGGADAGTDAGGHVTMP